MSSIENSKQADSQTLLRFAGIYRIDFFSGRASLEVKNPGHVVSWIVDARGIVRAGVAIYLTRFQVIYRENASAPWEKIADYNYDEEGIVPIAVAADNHTLVVACNGGEDHTALYTFDPKTKKILDLAFRHADVDIDAPILSEKNQLLGATCDAERPETFWFEPERRKWQQAVDKTLTNTVNSLASASLDGTRAIFLASSDRTPGAYYLLNSKTMRLEKFFELAEWIHPEEMAEMTPIQYQARDGLTIHGY